MKGANSLHYTPLISQLTRVPALGNVTTQHPLSLGQTDRQTIGCAELGQTIQQLLHYLASFPHQYQVISKQQGWQ